VGPPRRLLAALCAAAALAAGAGAASTLAAYSTPTSGQHCAHRSSYQQSSGSPGEHAGCRAHHGRPRPPRGSAACHGTLLRPTARNLSAIRAAVFCLVNRERARHGELALRPNMRLRRAAQRHSESMAFEDYFDHVEPGGGTPLARMRASGYISKRSRSYAVGENIAWGTLWLSTPRAIVASWMASPGHRANILDPRYRDTAIGVSAHLPGSFAHGQPGAIYTQDFGVIVSG